MVGLFWATRSYWIWKNNPEFPITWAESMIVGLIEWYLWGLCALLIYWVCLKRPFQRSNWWKTLAIHTGLAVVVSLVQLFVFNAIERPIDSYFMKGKTFPQMEFFWPSYFYIVRIKIHSAIMAYTLIAMVSYAILHYRKYREEKLRAAELSNQLANAELNALKAQLQPHFLFNTLHTISSMMHEDTAIADRMVSRLSDLLRLVLSNGGRQTVSLREELEFTEAYLDIERVRFSDRLRTSIDVPPDALEVEVPSLILQPLIENAIRHGVSARTSGGTVSISAHRVNGRLQLAITDSGNDTSSTDATSPGRGIGLANVRERLLRLYGDDQQFSLRNNGGGMTVTIDIPCRQTQLGQLR